MPSSHPDPIYLFRKNMAQINCLMLYFENNNELLFVGTSEGLVHIWNLKTKREEKNIKLCDSACLGMIPFKENIITQERGGCLKFWKIENLEFHLVNIVQIDYHGFCKILGCNNYLYVPTNNGIITTIQDNVQKTVCCDKINNVGEVIDMKYINNVNSLLVAYECEMLSLWSFKDGIANMEYEIKFKDTPMCLDFCEVTSEGVLGSSGDTVKKFRVHNFAISEIGSAVLTNPGVSSIIINKEGTFFITGCWDGRIRYFSMKHLVLLAALDYHSDSAIQCVMLVGQPLLSCSEGTLFAAGSDGRISLWDLYTSKKRKEIKI